uniref:Uncharacterized protein n=1 Tax=Utricularia reniformis TaxID=192314 RepID=A0A1Y0B441_9LAMI|nr:hypothetical protein AEK19_MT1934 [Utricularia reniformis]ART32099.1 hypothetical protein AEK19_MT1934 [Utricularia reniformis]
MIYRSQKGVHSITRLGQSSTISPVLQDMADTRSPSLQEDVDMSSRPPGCKEGDRNGLRVRECLSLRL